MEQFRMPETYDGEVESLLRDVVERVVSAEREAEWDQPSTSTNAPKSTTVKSVRFKKTVEVEVLEYQLGNKDRMPVVYPGNTFAHFSEELKKPATHGYQYPPLVDLPLIRSVAEQAETRRISELPDLSIPNPVDRGCGGACEDDCKGCKCAKNDMFCDARYGCRCHASRCQNRKAPRDRHLLRRRLEEANRRLADESMVDQSTIRSVSSGESIVENSDSTTTAIESNSVDDVRSLLNEVLVTVANREDERKWLEVRRNVDLEEIEAGEWTTGREEEMRSAEDEDIELVLPNSRMDDCTSQSMVAMIRDMWKMTITKRFVAPRPTRLLVKRKAADEFDFGERKKRKLEVDQTADVEGNMAPMMVDRDEGTEIDEIESIRSVASFAPEDIDEIVGVDGEDGEDVIVENDVDVDDKDSDSDAGSEDSVHTAIELRRSNRIRRMPDRWGYGLEHFPKSRRTTRRKKMSANRPTGSIRRVAAPPPPPAAPVKKVPRQLPFSCRVAPAPVRQRAPTAISCMDASTAPSSMAEFADCLVACKAKFDEFDWGMNQLDIMLAIKKFEKSLSSVGAVPTAPQLKRLTNALIRIRAMLGMKD